MYDLKHTQTNYFMENEYIKAMLRWRPVAHVCHPSYSGGRDQEECGSKPAQVKIVHETLSLKYVTQKGLVEWLKV
jgi:hypothetical protein